MILKKLVFILSVCSMTYSYASKPDQNPFLTEFKTQFNAPPFNLIKIGHYEPAFLEGIRQQNAEIKAIIANKAMPTFKNTIVAFDNSGSILRRVGGVFFNLTEAETNDSLTALSIKMAPVLSEHSDNVYLNKALFKRISTIHDQKKSLNLTREQERLLDLIYKKFVRSGAGLNDQKQARLRQINKELSTLEIDFSNHVLNETNAYKLVISDKKDLSGLPEWFIQSAANDAKAQGKDGKWIFTLQSSSRLPFLQYADNRNLREQIYNAYINRANKGDKNDNKAIISKVITLRLEKAKLLGFDTYANFVLDENMAKNSATVMSFLNKLWGYSIANAKKEAAELQKIMDSEGKGEKLAGWDWWYYSEKLRQEKYNLNEEDLKPYFKLENVREGVFAVAKKLYGVTLTELKDFPVYHPDVKAFDVKDSNGAHLGVFYVDYFPRPGKRGGAWMNNYKDQRGDIRPVICNVASFTKPSGDVPSLLTLDEVETLFHEFGHALHGLLSKCNYYGVSGTNVTRDFVELPSQIMEHWATEPEVLKMYAKHYKTGEVIPDSLIQKLKKQSLFNQGFMTTELLAAAILDMELHNLKDAKDLNIIDFEKKAMDKIGLISEIAPRYRCTYFNHIIGGYAAGYYSYLWANVLDSDAFEAFKEHGIFDKTTADAFRTNVLEKGGSEDPMELYKKFRGAEPKLEPMLKNRGLQ
ncbi:M3 family metallopeptidase [uncultured Bacteroides sp.]|uniref:M3 family metallopeptidase n=1 Tax=uncultured Bacteroides sp. TaxID=162156 RepID=UPI002AA6504F|nr:M3 family metallopeptidase [uncultured Bacteroides sp.]